MAAICSQEELVQVVSEEVAVYCVAVAAVMPRFCEACPLTPVNEMDVVLSVNGPPLEVTPPPPPPLTIMTTGYSRGLE